MTPTGTNLLGMLKHLGAEEYGYLGEVFDRHPQEPAPAGLVWLQDSVDWDAEASGSPDMWARPEEPSDYIVGFYRRACAHADETITTLDWDAPGYVPWWDEAGRKTILGTILIRMLGETLRHAGHVDIVRELIDGHAGTEKAEVGDERWWREYVAQVQAAADSFSEPS
jgi:hypothetical protein